jgi:hypothetical protein
MEGKSPGIDPWPVIPSNYFLFHRRFDAQGNGRRSLFWKSILDETVFGRFGSAISIEQVNAKARIYGLRR